MKKEWVALGVVLITVGVCMILSGIWWFNIDYNYQMEQYGYTYKAGMAGITLATFGALVIGLGIGSLATGINFGKQLGNDLLKLRPKIEFYTRRIQEREERGRSTRSYRRKLEKLVDEVQKKENQLKEWDLQKHPERQDLHHNEDMQGVGNVGKPAGSKFCPFCGRQKVNPNKNFCAFCGKKY
ncbi:MAG: hypothetical protein ACFFCS_29090 [Candidatus Hodarchaeota archaeon]